MTNRPTALPERGLASIAVTAVLVLVLGVVLVSLTCRGGASPPSGAAAIPGPTGPQPAASLTLR